VLVSTIIKMAQALGLGVVAEGVEDFSQLLQLQDEKCDQAQGFLLAGLCRWPTRGRSHAPREKPGYEPNGPPTKDDAIAGVEHNLRERFARGLKEFHYFVVVIDLDR